MTGGSGALYWTSDRVTLANYNATGVVQIEANGGTSVAVFGGVTYNNDFVGTGRFTGALRVDHSTAGAYGAVIYNTSATGQGLTVRGGSTSSQDAFNVQTYDGNRSLLSVQGGGNVGIGTSSPASLLSIAGSSSTQLKGLILRNGDGTTNSSVTLDFEASAGTIGDTASLAGRIEGIRTGAGTSGALAFSTTNSGTLTERMRITSGGQVGIGTTSWSQPYTKLIVAGAIAYNNNGDDAVSDNSYGQSFAKKIDIVGNSGANTIYSAAGSEGAFYVISGLNQTTGARFVDLLLYLGAASTTPVVVSSQTYLSPGGRTYGNSGENLTLSVTGNSNTYTIRMTGMGANERS
jgi:hypothetical protein